jgi:tetratricopeptide (TPR) repeat protein
MSWVGGATALIGLLGSLAGGVTWYVNHHRQQAARQAKMAIALTQVNQQEYQAAVQSYGDILKDAPLNRPALDGQLNAAMLWVENFRVAAREDQNAADISAPALDQIMATLDAGLARTKGLQAADVQAHLGWAHWLNQRIAQREFSPSAEQNLRAALQADPTNVYANGMLGAWMLQTGGNFNEAIQHLNAAVATGKARPLIRGLQFGSLIYLEKPGARAELVKAANEMRKSGEALDQRIGRRILGFCFDPVVTDHAELSESLTAVSPDDAWKTYLWLDDLEPAGRDETTRSLVRTFIQANLLELSGKPRESLDKYRQVQREWGDRGTTMRNSVDAAIARLSRQHA